MLLMHNNVNQDEPLFLRTACWTSEASSPDLELYQLHTMPTAILPAAGKLIQVCSKLQPWNQGSNWIWRGLYKRLFRLTTSQGQLATLLGNKKKKKGGGICANVLYVTASGERTFDWGEQAWINSSVKLLPRLLFPLTGGGPTNKSTTLHHFTPIAERARTDER